MARNESVPLVLATSIAAFLTPFTSAAANIALPTIGRELGADAAALNWVATSFLLAAAMFLVPFGKLSDIRGRRRMFAEGLVVYAAGSVACGLAPTVALLIAMRLVQGIGAAMIFGTATAILTSAFPPGQRGRMLGLNVGITYIGLSLGPFLGGLLTQYLGWRSVFWAGAGLACAGFAVVAVGIRSEWAEARGERFDLPGSAVYAAGLAALMVGLSLLPGLAGVGCIIAGSACLALFVLRQLRISHPVLGLSLFRGNRVFALSNLAALISYSATFAVGYLMSLYLQEVRGLSPQAAGLVLLAQPALQAAFSPLAGRASDRLEPRLLASVGMAITALAMVPLALAGPRTPLAIEVACLAVLGLGFALFSSPNTNAVMSAVERRSYGVASATLGTMRLLGQMMSMGMVMVAFALSMGRARIDQGSVPGFMAAMRAVLLLGAGLCVAGVFASLARGTVRPRSETPLHE
jgi:EmrB/QacA subfamily drug resistance transporter